MKYLDNDMDDLFNKAGQNYPLNTNSGNWDAVQKALESGAPAAAPAKKNRARRYLPLLLLLLPLAIFITGQLQLESPAAEKKESKHNVSKDAAGGVHGTDIEESGQQSAELFRNSSTIPQTQKAGTIPDLKPASAATDTRLTQGVLQSKTEKPRTDDLKTTGERTQSNEEETQTGTKRQLKALLYNATPEFIYTPGAAPYESISKPVVASGPAQTGHVPPSPKRTKSNLTVYYGVKAGMDLTTIKYQAIKRPGSSVGALLGFRFGSQWSIEAAALWSSKKYYTQGRYFDKERAGIPASTDVQYLDGGCNMIEVPLVLRYSFSPARKNSFFAAAGITSFFMNRESYEYYADAGWGPYEGHRSYRKTGNHLFANVHVSGGYEARLFKGTQIRIEPYLQLPVKNVGIGRMPITSAGVHFGVVRGFR